MTHNCQHPPVKVFPASDGKLICAKCETTIESDSLVRYFSDHAWADANEREETHHDTQAK